MVFKVLIPVMSKEERGKKLKPPEGSKKRGKETSKREEAGKNDYDRDRKARRVSVSGASGGDCSWGRE